MLEIILLVPLVVACLYQAAKDVQLLEKSSEPIHPQVEMVLELLQSLDGWDFKKYAPFYIVHETGVKIYVADLDWDKNARVSFRVTDDAGAWQPGVDLTDKDRDRIRKRVLALKKEREEIRVREVTKSLARRVLANERGEALPPLLGGPGLGDGREAERARLGLATTFDPLAGTSYGKPLRTIGPGHITILEKGERGHLYRHL